MRTQHSWMHPALEVRKSSINGNGVFATSKINANERLTVFGGDIMLIDEINCLPEQLQDFPMQIEERFVIGLRTAREPEDTDWFNHSCDPNAGFKGQIFLVAMRDIWKDEEVTFDYCMVLSQSVGSDIVFTMDCQCQSKNCRKVISEEDWKKPELQAKYSGFFSEYLATQIAGVDFSSLSEGDIEPTLKKRIDTLIEATDNWIVYLDDDLYVEWSAKPNFDDDTELFSTIVNKVAKYESLSAELLSKRHVKPFHRLLGEAIARAYEDKTEQANEIITEAEDYLKARSNERARIWYWCSSGAVVIFTSMAILAIKLNYPSFHRWAGPDWTNIIIGSLFGSIGAFISIISRSSDIAVNAAAGWFIHFLDGVTRVSVAVLGAFLVALCLKANLVLGVPTGLESPLLYIIAFCIVAGASERIVPDLIQKVGGQAQGTDTPGHA